MEYLAVTPEAKQRWPHSRGVAKWPKMSMIGRDLAFKKRGQEYQISYKLLEKRGYNCHHYGVLSN